MAKKTVAARQGEIKYAGRRSFVKGVTMALAAAALPAAIAATPAVYPRAQLTEYEVRLIAEMYEAAHARRLTSEQFREELTAWLA